MTKLRETRPARRHTRLASNWSWYAPLRVHADSPNGFR